MKKEALDQLIRLIQEHAAPIVAEAVEARIRQAAENRTPSAADELLRRGRRAGTPRDPTEEAESRGRTFQQLVVALAAGKMDPAKAIDHARKAWDLDADSDVVKALEAGDADAGGFLIAEQQSDELIELLRPRVVVRALGAEVVPMDGGNLKISRLSSGASDFWIGESEDITPSQQAFEMLALSSKKHATLVPISNDLIRRKAQASTIVRNDVLRAMAQGEDLAFIRGSGTQHTPMGLRNRVNAANVLTATAGDTLTSITDDLSTTVLALEEADVPFERVAWMFAPRTRQRLMTVRDANGNFAFRDEMLTGRLWGWPFGTTTQIPRNLGAGSDESEVYLTDMSEFIIGQESEFIVSVSEEASYFESGSLKSAFSRDQTVMKVLSFVDTGLRHDLAGAVLTQVTWGS